MLAGTAWYATLHGGWTVVVLDSHGPGELLLDLVIVTGLAILHVCVVLIACVMVRAGKIGGGARPKNARQTSPDRRRAP